MGTVGSRQKALLTSLIAVCLFLISGTWLAPISAVLLPTIYYITIPYCLFAVHLLLVAGSRC